MTSVWHFDYSKLRCWVPGGSSHLNNLAEWSECFSGALPRYNILYVWGICLQFSLQEAGLRLNLSWVNRPDDQHSFQQQAQIIRQLLGWSSLIRVHSGLITQFGNLISTKWKWLSKIICTGPPLYPFYDVPFTIPSPLGLLKDHWKIVSNAKNDWICKFKMFDISLDRTLKKNQTLPVLLELFLHA